MLCLVIDVMQYVDQHLQHGRCDNQRIDYVECAEYVLILDGTFRFLNIEVPFDLVQHACEQVRPCYLVILPIWLLEHRQDVHGVGEAEGADRQDDIVNDGVLQAVVDDVDVHGKGSEYSQVH